MSKPRWIDGGVFNTLRTATRKRTLAIIAGPRHGSAELSSRQALREALGDGDRAALAEDARCRSEADAGLAAAVTLKLPGLATTSVANAIEASLPADLEVPTRRYGPDSKGIKGAYDRKDFFVAHLLGAAAEPESLVLTGKERKALVKQDSRYQAFLRATFSRTVLLSGFDLGDPDLDELLEDVSRVFNGHVPPNIALIPSDSADPGAALKASMHYGMTLVEYPAQLSAADALAQVCTLLEELEIPKPATGDPPRGFEELTSERRATPGAFDVEAFVRGESGTWAAVATGEDVPREAAAGLKEFLEGAPPAEGKVPVALVRGAAGEGKSTLARRVAWDLAEAGLRVFWREPGAGLPDRYVPAEADDFRAVFVLDDASELASLPVLLRNLAKDGQGKARFLVVADADDWDRSGLDHRIRQHAAVLDVSLTGLNADEAGALAERLAGHKQVADGVDAQAVLSGDIGCVLDGVTRVRLGKGLEEAIAERLAGLDETQKKALLAVALVHEHGMGLDRAHLAAALGLEEGALDKQVLEPLADLLTGTSEGAVRNAHELHAGLLVKALAGDTEVRDALVVALLTSLSAEREVGPTVLHKPSELIRAVRHAPLAPLTLASFFEAGEGAARNDVLFWFDRGRSEADFSRWEAALQSFDQALWRQPGETAEKEHNAVVHANRARCLQSLGRKKEALAAVEEGLRFSPRDSSLIRLAEKLGGRRRGPPRGRGGPGGRSRGGRGGPGGGGGGGGRGGPGGGRGGPGGGRGGPGGGRAGAGAGGPQRPGGGGGRQPLV